MQDIAYRLMLLTSEMLSAKARLHDSSEQPSDITPRAGTLDYSIVALQSYCNDLENRVVNRFDFCTAAFDQEGMKECANIMAKLNKESVLAQVSLPLCSTLEQALSARGTFAHVRCSLT